MANIPSSLPKHLQRKQMPAKIYGVGGNFTYRWSTKETITFLNLLKRYPILYSKYVPNKDTIVKRKSALQSLLKETTKARLSLRDKDALRSKINILKGSLVSAVDIYKRKALKTPYRLPDTSLAWFEHGLFLDTSGTVRKLRQRVQGGKKNPVKPPTTTTEVAPSPERRFPRRAQPIDFREHQPTSPDVSTTGSSVGIKLEVENEDDDDDREEGEWQQDGDELEQGGGIADHGHVSCFNRSEGNVQATVASPQQRHTQPQTAPAVPLRPTDYFHAFLDYTRLRTEKYSARQKREIINLLSGAMNRIDEENEALEVQDYSIQMFNSFNEFSSTAKE